MEHVLPPPVLGALVAAPPQVHFITFTIGGVFLAVLARAEPGPVRTEPFSVKNGLKFGNETTYRHLSRRRFMKMA